MNGLNNNNLLKIGDNWLEPKVGRVLISEPFSGEKFFEKSVIFIVEQSEKGTVGFILNKKIKFDVDFNGLMKFFGSFPTNLSFGGPVSVNCVFSLHSFGPEIVPDCKKITDGVYYGGSYKTILSKIDSGEISERDVRFFLGYAGWSPKQLDEEINKKFWVVGNLDPKLIFNAKTDIWSEAVGSLGGHYKMWQNLPSNPIWN